MNDLLQSIEDSKVLDPDQKRVLVNIYPRLDEEQRNKLTAFLAREKEEFSAIEKAYQDKKSPLYKEYLEQLKQAFTKAEKLVASEAERSSTEKEQAELSGLLKQL